MHQDDYDHDETGRPHPGHNWAAHDRAAQAPALDLGEDERLPWLESADDFDRASRGSGGLIGFAAAALLVLAALVAGIYWLAHRGTPAKPADGSLIEAGKDPYKVAPTDPGGKQFAGTGDTSFKVSQGDHPDASLAGSAGTTPPPASASAAASPAPTQTAAATPPAAAPAAAAPAVRAAHTATSAVAVQVGAYSSHALAEAAWRKLSAAHDLLQSLDHRVVEGKADIGTVYRLQALAADGRAANSLCSRLEGEGVKCQVKR